MFRIADSAAGSAVDWRGHYFEAESAVVDQIVNSLNLYLDEQAGAMRESFQKKPARKSSFFKRTRVNSTDSDSIWE